jgi:hypothetical protein
VHRCPSWRALVIANILEQVHRDCGCRQWKECELDEFLKRIGGHVLRICVMMQQQAIVAIVEGIRSFQWNGSSGGQGLTSVLCDTKTGQNYV